MPESSNNTHRTTVQFHTVTANESGQRIDNFLMKKLKSVPKSLVYRILRKGEVRIDKKRAKPNVKIQEGNIVRIPPVTLADKKQQEKAPDRLLNEIEQAILDEDDDIIFINKPSGLPVHGGSGIRFGLIETFRQLRPNMDYVELVHRLDKETSGIVMLAKNRQTLNQLHDLLRGGNGVERIEKYYQTLVLSCWNEGKKYVSLDLEKQQGKWKKVQVQKGGKISESIFDLARCYQNESLLEVQILTGRMHQIRTQLAYLGYPILGDDRYGDYKANRHYKKLGLKRLFLHSSRIKFQLPASGKYYNLSADLPKELVSVLEKLEKNI